MPRQGNLIQIVHAGAPEGPVRDRKTGRFDDMRGHAETGAQAQNRSGILRDIRLVKRDVHPLRLVSLTCPFGAKLRAG